MREPLFSIIIPVWNAEKTLPDCLNSITKQKSRSFETIIVDGISTDNTIEIIKSYAASHNNIRWTSETDDGIYDAMNKGIQNAKGEWLYFLGSDDTLYDADVLANVAAGIKEDVDIMYGNAVWAPENINEEGEWGYSQLLKRCINHQRVFYRRSLFERLGSYNNSYKIAADHELNVRFFCEPAVKKEYINCKLAHYHAGGFSANKIDENFWNDWESIIHKNFSPYLPQKEIYESLGWYCWYNIHKKKYGKSFRLFCSIYFHTFSFSFLKHSLSQTLKSFREQ